MGILSIVGLAVIITDAPLLWEGFRKNSWPLVVFSCFFGSFALGALWRRKFFLAAICSQSAVAGVILGWIAAQYPVLVWPSITVDAAKSPDSVLWAMIFSLAVGSIFLIPSLAWLFYLFKGRRPQ